MRLRCTVGNNVGFKLLFRTLFCCVEIENGLVLQLAHFLFGALGAALVAAGIAQAVGFQLHQPVGVKPDHLVQQIGVGGLLKQRFQLHLSSVIAVVLPFGAECTQRSNPTGEFANRFEPP